MSFTAKITADITKFEQNIGKAIDSTNRLENTVSAKLSKMGDSFVNAGRKASILSAALVAAGGKAFMMAADFEDAIGATGQIFSDNADIVKGWADTLGTEYGIAKKEALEYSNLMGSMLINIGKLTEEQAARQSAKLIELAGDLTAMYGGSTQDAVRALTGALKGNNTMLDNYGMAVNDALVKTRAFEMGLSDGTGELSLQAKQAATLALIYEQTTAAQGQAAREADGASGSMRALTTEVKNLSTELGQILIPVVTPVVAGIRDMVAGLRTLSPEMQKTIVVVGGIAAAIGPLLVGFGSVLKMLPLIKTAMIALSGPVGLVVAAVAGAALLIISNWDKIKEYFTSGGGAELFNTIKSIAVEIKDFLVGSWNDIKDLGITIWNAIGSDVINIVKNVLSNITSILTVLVKTFRNVAQILHGIFTLDFKSALDGLKNLFLDIFKGLTDIAFNALSTISGLLATFFDWIGLDKWAASVNNFSNKIAEMVRPSVQATDAIEEVGESATKTKTSVDNLTTSFKELGEAQEKATAKIAPDNVTGVSVLAPVIEPTIDAQGLKEKLRDTTYGALADLGEGIKVLTIDLSSMLSGALTDVFGSVSDAMMNGDNMMAALGASLLGTLGGIMVQLGQMVIATGSAIEAVKVALSSLGGIGAIAAGVALIAIGSLFKAGASKLSRSMGSGGGGYSSAPSMGNTSPGYGPSEYRGAYQDDFQVTFKIGTNELVGVLNTAEQRRNRI